MLLLTVNVLCIKMHVYKTGMPQFKDKIHNQWVFSRHVLQGENKIKFTRLRFRPAEMLFRKYLKIIQKNLSEENKTLMRKLLIFYFITLLNALWGKLILTAHMARAFIQAVNTSSAILYSNQGYLVERARDCVNTKHFSVSRFT